MNPIRRLHRGTLLTGAGTLTILLMVLFSPPAFAQDSHSGESLELTLEIDKTTLVLGEPVYASVRLTNRGSAPVQVSKLLDPQLGNVHIIVSSPQRPRVVYLPLFVSDAAHARTTLAPGETVAAAFPIFYGSLGWTFPRPASYRVTAEYRSSGQAAPAPASSRPVSLTIADDGGVGTLLLNGTPASEEAGKFLLWQRGDHLQHGQTLLADVLKTHPDSPVAEYARLALGHNLSRDFRNYAVGRIRPADCETALTYLQKVRADQLPALLQVQAYLDEARCLATLSQATQASEALARAKQAAGERPEFQLLFQQAGRLEPSLQRTP